MMRLVMMLGCIWVTHSFGQWSGAESLQRRESGILGGYYYSAYIPQLTKTSAFIYGEKINHTDIHVLKILWNGKLGNQNFLLGFEQERSSYLQQSVVSLGYGKKISNQVFMGLKLGYDGIYARGYGSRGKLNSGFGLFLKVTDRIYWALQLNHLESFTSSYYWKDFEGKAGIGWIVSDGCGLSVTLHLNEKRNTLFEIGLLYQILDKVRWRFEFETKIPGFKTSIGYQFRQLEAEIFSQYRVTGNTSFGLGIFHTIRKKSV